MNTHGVPSEQNVELLGADRGGRHQDAVDLMVKQRLYRGV